jgi:hypothetical protein
MPVQGYNVVPDENDHEAIIGIEIETTNEQFNGKACVYIGEGYGQTEIHLDYNELLALLWQGHAVRAEMEWAQASFVFAPGVLATDKTHLQRKGDDPHGKALCGQMPTSWGITGDREYAWDQSPVLGDPQSDHTCKRCYAKWQKLQQEA